MEPARGPDDPERELVARARAGDQGAFRALVERHQDRAVGLARRMLRSSEDAEDVAQEAFVRAWLSLSRFRGESSFGTWLHRIVARRALDRAVVLQTRRRRESPLEAAGPEPAGAAGPDAEASRRALRLEALMERLSPAQRAVVSLFYWEERPVDEIASLLGMPPGTVKTHLHRARAALREGWVGGEGAA